MSRRHRNRSSHHGRPRPEGPRPATSLESPVARSSPDGALSRPARIPTPEATPAPQSAVVSPEPPPAAAPPSPGSNGHAVSNGTGCTAPQLRRFIKSRPYVPMHELRRRFAIDGDDDDVSHVDLDGGRVYLGLPHREGGLLGELLRSGEIGYELSLDPRTPIVVGVYPMRPVPRS